MTDSANEVQVQVWKDAYRIRNLTVNEIRDIVNGEPCECVCGCGGGEHFKECEPCLPCRILHAMDGVWP